MDSDWAALVSLTGEIPGDLSAQRIVSSRGSTRANWPIQAASAMTIAQRHTFTFGSVVD